MRCNHTKAEARLDTNRGKRFAQWINTISDSEHDLRMQAIGYEHRYFSDLTLQNQRIAKKLATYEMQADDGRWVTVQDDLQLGVTLSGLWIFRYRRLRRRKLGCCHTQKRLIEIKAGLKGKVFKGTLLHKMIHAYEEMLKLPFRDWLLLDLYQRMKRKIGERAVRRCINVNTHTRNSVVSHGVLFLLKSLELDERLGWKHGTVFGYGRDEWFT